MKRIFAVLAATLSLNAFAEAPKEPVPLASSYDPKAPSISVQGLGNKILDAATAPKYLLIAHNGVNYAYSIKRLGSGDVKYVGKQSDIDGLVFLDVTAYKDGRKLNSQLTIYRQSKFSNAIYLQKFDRNEKRPYQFDLGLDSDGRLMIVNKPNDVLYMKPVDELQKAVPFAEKNSEFNF